MKNLSRLSLVERAVLEAVLRCPRPQMKCLIKKARKLYPRWGIVKEDIIWGIGRLRRSGILKGKYGKRGQAALVYRMANPLRRKHYQIRFQKRVWRETKRLKRQHRRDRLLGLSLRKKGYNARPRRTPYKWFVKYYGIKEGAKYYRQAQRKRYYP